MSMAIQKFVVPFATFLAFGQNPSNKQYDQPRMASHLDRLQKNSMENFPLSAKGLEGHTLTEFA
jgi:hypothetical protein